MNVAIGAGLAVLTGIGAGIGIGIPLASLRNPSLVSRKLLARSART